MEGFVCARSNNGKGCKGGKIQHMRAWRADKFACSIRFRSLKDHSFEMPTNCVGDSWQWLSGGCSDVGTATPPSRNKPDDKRYRRFARLVSALSCASASYPDKALVRLPVI